jgi:hypothetical protein
MHYYKKLNMETGILKEYFNDLIIKTPDATFSLCKGSEEALQKNKSKYIGRHIQFYLLSSNKAVCVNII